ncbi:MAG: beta-ketoacyl-[acyl-carrier-protein] synthase family protein [Phycisphaeraceae bacterium]|nr:beta-ketoacyl-[acyl-carrier-protein] synthase family protein [Phycisphaeraceae bacterium]
MNKRVVITGMGAITPLGIGVSSLYDRLECGDGVVQQMPDWVKYKGLGSRVAALAPLEDERAIPRRTRRSMGRLSLFAAQAAKQAVVDADLSDQFLTSSSFGCIAGSTMGSAGSITEVYELMLPEYDLSLMPSSKFFQCISHTAAMNVAQYLGIRGVVLATSAACASGLQAIGTGYDVIRCGRQVGMLCGGAEEVHPTVTGSFDVLYATSTNYNDCPSATPRPFDKDRDGLVCGEGSGMLVLEEYEHARNRGARIYGEIIGYHTCGSGTHISQSNAQAMSVCMRRAMEMANVDAKNVDYINAHATATLQGDVEEAAAIADVFGSDTPVSSLKGALGHTLGASGPIELIASLIMVERNKIIATRNLETIDPACNMIRHVQTNMTSEIDVFLKNSFAFGNINAAILCRRADTNRP